MIIVDIDTQHTIHFKHISICMTLQNWTKL